MAVLSVKDFPDDVFTQLDIIAAQHRLNKREVVIEALRAYVESAPAYPLDRKPPAKSKG